MRNIPSRNENDSDRNAFAAKALVDIVAPIIVWLPGERHALSRIRSDGRELLEWTGDDAGTRTILQRLCRTEAIEPMSERDARFLGIAAPGSVKPSVQHNMTAIRLRVAAEQFTIAGVVATKGQTIWVHWGKRESFTLAKPRGALLHEGPFSVQEWVDIQNGFATGALVASCKTRQAQYQRELLSSATLVRS